MLNIIIFDQLISVQTSYNCNIIFHLKHIVNTHVKNYSKQIKCIQNKLYILYFFLLFNVFLQFHMIYLIPEVSTLQLVVGETRNFMSTLLALKRIKWTNTIIHLEHSLHCSKF